MKDNEKAWLLMGVVIVGYVAVWFVIRQHYTLMYGIPAIPMVWSKIMLNTKPEERRVRPIFKVLGIFLIILFVGMTILGTIIELTKLNRGDV